jgi:hypothetical protein
VSVSHDFTSSSHPAGEAGEELDIASLLNALGEVEDRRSPQGKVYGLVFVLAASLVAVLAGASNFRQIADQVADFPQPVLRKLGGTWCWFREMFRWPSKDTIRRVLTDIDAAALDLVIGAWLQERVNRDQDGLLRLAIDGKVLRGAWTDENDQFTLFSAMVHQDGVTVAQVQVSADTNEITQVKALLDGVSAQDGDRVVARDGRRAHPTSHRRIPRYRTRIRLHDDHQGQPANPAGVGVHNSGTPGENPARSRRA